MLPKVHLTSHSRMSGFRWVTTPSWFSRSLRPFLYSSSVYSCHLFLIFSASVRSLPFLSFIVLILGWNVPLIPSIFLKRSLVFPILLFSYTSLHCSFKKAFLSPCSSLKLCIQLSASFSFSPAFCLLFSRLFLRPPQTTTLTSSISFSWIWFWSLFPVQCYKPHSIVLQALYLIKSFKSICYLTL